MSSCEAFLEETQLPNREESTSPDIEFIGVRSNGDNEIGWLDPKEAHEEWHGDNSGSYGDCVIFVPQGNEALLLCVRPALICGTSAS